ncbi:MAG: substrate-binding domain-containing protein [Microthrixaceae bacterium]|nr:substrate-binding domain-containing protein [Microthrixaceae bacterium]
MGASDRLPAGPLLAGAGLLLGSVLVCASCGTPAVGNIVVSGSSTVEPITIAVAEKFAEIHDDVNVFVDGPGTGDGFELFCDGETDINDASSPIAPEQIETCARNGVEFIELRVGNDGIVMLTNAGNDAVDCLRVGDVYALVGPGVAGHRHLGRRRGAGRGGGWFR